MDPDAAQELLADTFAEAYCLGQRPHHRFARSRRRFKPERGFARNWVFGIAQHLLFGSYRRLEVRIARGGGSGSCSSRRSTTRPTRGCPKEPCHERGVRRRRRPRGTAARDAARRSRRRWIAPLAGLARLLAGSTAAATGVIWSEPKIDNSVPSVPEWQYWATNPFADGGGPVLMRAHPAALERVNRADEQARAAKGMTARCGGDPGHPPACFTPGGELVPIVASTDTLGPADYDVKPLSGAEARAWLCAHPTQRPGADGGEKPAPIKGYEDC